MLRRVTDKRTLFRVTHQVICEGTKVLVTTTYESTNGLTEVPVVLFLVRVCTKQRSSSDTRHNIRPSHTPRPNRAFVCQYGTKKYRPNSTISARPPRAHHSRQETVDADKYNRGLLPRTHRPTDTKRNEAKSAQVMVRRPDHKGPKGKGGTAKDDQAPSAHSSEHCGLYAFARATGNTWQRCVCFFSPLNETVSNSLEENPLLPRITAAAPGKLPRTRHSNR